MGTQILMFRDLWRVTEPALCPSGRIVQKTWERSDSSSEAENDQCSSIVCWFLSISKSFRLIPYANKFRVIIYLYGWSSVCCNLEVTKGPNEHSISDTRAFAGVRDPLGIVWLKLNNLREDDIIMTKIFAFQEPLISKRGKISQAKLSLPIFNSISVIFTCFFLKVIIKSLLDEKRLKARWVTTQDCFLHS